MTINKVVTDRKPKNCIECPLLGKRPCGKQHKVQVSSGSTNIEYLPDERCVIRPSGKCWVLPAPKNPCGSSEPEISLETTF